MPTDVASPPSAPGRPPHAPHRLNPRALIAAGVILALVVAFALTRGSSSDDVSTKKATTTVLARAGQPDGGPANGAASTTTSGAATGSSGGSTAAADETPIPVELSTSNATGLADGDAVTIHATAKPGSLLYGYEARLCTSGTTYRFDADMRPTQLGKCISKPFSDASDNYQQVAAPAPYAAVDGSFRVGEGTDTYQTQDGRTVTITCDHDHPCTLVVKLQFTDGFGFRSIPISYR